MTRARILVTGGAGFLGSPIVHAPLPKDDPVRRNPNIGRAQQLLGGWTPVVPLGKGIAETIAYFRGVLGSGG